MLSNSPGNIGFEAAPFKLPFEYVEVLGGVDGEPLKEFRRLFGEGFEAARKHCDRIITMVELMQKGEHDWTVHSTVPNDVADSTMPCFAAFGDQTAAQLRERFQQALTHSLVAEHVDRLIDTSLGSNWTRLYDSVSSSLPHTILRDMLTWRLSAIVVPILFPVHFVLVLVLVSYGCSFSCSLHFWSSLFPCGL